MTLCSKFTPFNYYYLVQKRSKPTMQGSPRPPKKKTDNARLKKILYGPPSPLVKKKVLSDESRSRDKVILKS